MTLNNDKIKQLKIPPVLKQYIPEPVEITNPSYVIGVS